MSALSCVLTLEIFRTQDGFQSETKNPYDLAVFLVVCYLTREWKADSHSLSNNGILIPCPMLVSEGDPVGDEEGIPGPCFQGACDKMEKEEIHILKNTVA